MLRQRCRAPCTTDCAAHHRNVRAANHLADDRITLAFRHPDGKWRKWWTQAEELATDQLDVETLERRITEAAQGADAVLVPPTVVGASSHWLFSWRCSSDRVRSRLRPELGGAGSESKQRHNVEVHGMKTLGLSFLIALGTLLAMALVGLGFFVSGGGIIFPALVAWVSGSLFALSRRPRHLWLQVALLGVLVAASINLYFFALPRLVPPPPGYLQGGPNVPR